MAIQAASRITFSKVVDGISGTFSVIPSVGGQIMSKDPKAYSPSFTSTAPLYITPSLKILGIGDTSEQIKGTCTWTINGQAINGTTEVAETSGSYRLKITHNLTKPINVVCKYTWQHPVTKQQLEFKGSCPVNLTENAGTMIMAQILPDTISTFKTTAGGTENLTFIGSMVRGGDVDDTDVNRTWYIYGPATGKYYEIDQSTGKVKTTPDTIGIPKDKVLFSFADNAKKITVNSDAVLNVGGLKLEARDTDPTSSTYNKTVSYIQPLIDDTDPIQMEMAPIDGLETHASASGNRVEFKVAQDNYDWKEADYVGKTIAFYRCTVAGEKDTTWAPASTEFANWTINSGVVSRKFTSSATGTQANRTVTFLYSHMLANAIQTSFESYLDF